MFSIFHTEKYWIEIFTMTCYSIDNGNTGPAGGNFVPCGSNTSGVPQYCCASGDLCLGYSICHFSYPNRNGQAATILAAAQSKAILVPHVQRNVVSSRKPTHLEGYYI